VIHKPFHTSFTVSGQTVEYDTKTNTRRVVADDKN